ncbi:carbohydrate ABC transporter permease [Brachybacterium muris]|uniref:carbohydrate ABC transporter permease n=1 Tax=Brachybacterium muris TaxID=219301 RepID=UPI00223B58EC|nr:carbohydrate ABC transporter permease [Brachybacterium muris]MCT2260222.1 carbohydrate ABC transporter permease [Brachybacterium muris]
MTTSQVTGEVITPRKQKVRPLELLGRYTALFVLMAFLLLPAAWMAFSSLKPNSMLFGATPDFTLEGVSLDNYRWALRPDGMDMGQLLINTFSTNLMSALLTTAFCAVAGYGLARYKGGLARALVAFLVISQMIQGPMIMVPWYQIAATLDLINTREVLVLIYQTLTIPAAIWLMAGFYRAIPVELEEAAAMDGCSKLGTFWRIILPLSLPGLAAISLYAFILGWNDYQYALILTSSEYSKTLQIGIAQVMNSIGATNWGGILAAGTIAVIPAVILFSLVQKTLISGLTAGSVKG